MEAEERALLDRLGDGAYGAHGNTIEDATCLEGTREGILQSIGDWVQDTSSLQRVLWIHGMAGRGKSTIATTVADRHWRNQGTYALFHFRRGQEKLEKGLVCSLAKQLGTRGSPHVKEAILGAIRENKDIAQERLDKQFKVLLFGPLKEYPPESPPILLVIDALDECEDVTYAPRFIELINTYSASLPPNIRFILTTRPELPLLDALRLQEWRSEDLDLIAEVDHDVERFIRSELSKIRRQKKHLPADWPPSESVQALVTMSNGLFQWASTAVKHIGSGSPDHRLKNLLRNSSGLQGLDNLYRQILSNAFEKAKENSDVDLLRRALATIVAAPYPISLEVIAYLLADQEVLRDRIQTEAYCDFLRDDVLLNVVSILSIPSSIAEPVRLMHTSIRDLLVDAERSNKSPYHVNLPQVHWELARGCLQLMVRDLKKNICNLSDLSKSNSDPYVKACLASRVHAGLQFCCRSWAAHLAATHKLDLDGGNHGLMINDLQEFSEKNLLQWIEVMSLIEGVGEAIAMAKQTEKWTIVR